MKYFYDTEFLEGNQDKRLLGIKIGETKPTIDIISIGIVSEDGREYYAVSKDFNLKEAWNRVDIKKTKIGNNPYREYWVRDNVLRPIFNEWVGEDINSEYYNSLFTYKYFKYLLKKNGKSNYQIAKEIKAFVLNPPIGVVIGSATIELIKQTLKNIKQGYVDIELYGYYSAYDHVVFCWLFGKMIDLPKGFPMYTFDLKQMLDEKAKDTFVYQLKGKTVEDGVKEIKSNPQYPKQANEHHALSDAIWNKELFKFLIKL